MIATWWAGLSLSMKILWGVTLAASLIFIIQTVLTFIGADADSTGLDGADLDAGGMDTFDADFGDSDAGASDGGANLYTFRNFINFLLGFGWADILLQQAIPAKGLRIVVSVLIGMALVALVMYVFRLLGKMQQSGNINVYSSALGCQGTVYLTIPSSRSGEGKVQITINNAVREYNAMTEEDSPIVTGTPIKVTEVINNTTLLVEKLDSTII